MSYFLCCAIRRPPVQRAPRLGPDEKSVKADIPSKKFAIVALKLGSSNDFRTGVLIHNSLVLTSHINLPSKESSEGGEILLTGSCSQSTSYDTPPLNERPSGGLTRKLLPTRCFLTNPSLGVTIVGCDPVRSDVPLDIDTVEAPAGSLNVGRIIYVLGHVEHDDKRKGLIMFGEGRISLVDAHAIEFFSLDGNVWAPGSAGFDEQGNFAFLVGRSKSAARAKFWASCMQKTYLSAKCSSPKQPGVLFQFIREWKRAMWNSRDEELSKAVRTTKDIGTNPSPPSDRFGKPAQEPGNAFRGAQGKLLDLRLQSCPREGDPTSRKDCMEVANNLASLGSPKQDCNSPSFSDRVGPTAFTSTLEDITDLATRELQIGHREGFSSRKDCKGVGSNFGSLGSPILDCTYPDTPAYHRPNSILSIPGGIADLAVKELISKESLEPEHRHKEDFSRTVDEDDCNGASRNDFKTGFVKVKYFNKNTFLPDRMPAVDYPNKDPNAGSWYDWGKKEQTTRPLSPRETPKSVCGNPIVRLAFLNNSHCNFPDSGEAPDRLNIKESPRDSGLQPLRSERINSPRPELRANARLDELARGFHPRFPPASSPELSSPVQRLCTPALHRGVHSPRELAFGEIHRSTTSPRSPTKAQAVPWKPPAGCNGPPGSPLKNLKYVFEERRVVPVGIPRHGVPRCEKRGHCQQKSAEAEKVRKVGKHFVGSLHVVRYKVIEVCSLTLSGQDKCPWPSSVSNVVRIPETNGKLCIGLLDIWYVVGFMILPCAIDLNYTILERRENNQQPRKPRWSAHSRVHKEDDNRKLAALPPRVLKLGEFPTELFSKHDERDYPKLRVNIIRESTSIPTARRKKREQQARSKHALTGLQPLAPTVHTQTNKNTHEKQTSCCQAPEDTASSASESPSVLADNGPKIVSPILRKQIRSDEEILNEIERLQAVLRSPRGPLSRSFSPRGLLGWGSSPEQSVIDESMDSMVTCGGPYSADTSETKRCGLSPTSICPVNKFNESTEQKPAQHLGFTCFQYWKRLIIGRRDGAMEVTKTVLSAQPAAQTERQRRRRRRVVGSPRTKVHGESARACRDSEKYIHRKHGPQGAVWGTTPTKENIASHFDSNSPLPQTDMKTDESCSISSLGQRLVEFESPRAIKVASMIWNGPSCNGTDVKTPGLQDSSQPASRTAGTPPTYFLGSPSTDSRPHSGAKPSQRRDLSRSPAACKKKEPVHFAGPGRPRWLVTRVDSRGLLAETSHRLAPSHKKGASSRESIASSLGVELEALIFHKLNDNALLSSKQKLPSRCSSPRKPNAAGRRAKKRVRLGNPKYLLATETKSMPKPSAAEIRTDITASSCSDDGSFHCETSPVVRFPTPGKGRPTPSNQQRKWVP